MPFLGGKFNKPQRWGTDPSHARLEWQWFWALKNLVVYDTSQQAPGTLGTTHRFLTTPDPPLFQVARAGKVHKFTSDGKHFADSVFPAIEIPFCMMGVYETFDNFSTSGNRIISAGDAARDNEYVMLQESVANGISFTFRCNANTPEDTNWADLSQAASTSVEGKVRFAVGQSLTASSHEVWVDNLLKDTSVVTIDPSRITPVDFLNIGRLGRLTPQAGKDLGLHWCAISNQALTPSQIQQITHDPFGPFRRVDAVIGLAPTVVVAGADEDASLFTAGQQQPVLQDIEVVGY